MSARIVLASTFTSVPQGGVKSADDADAWRNDYPFDLWVDEIRFEWNAATGSLFSTLADVVQADIQYGNHKLTAGMVPVQLLAPVEDWETQVPIQQLTLGTTPASDVSYCWRLPKPMLLPRTNKLNIQIGNQNDFVAASGSTYTSPTVRVSLICRPVEGPSPNYVDLPYAGKWIGSIWGSSAMGMEPAQYESSGPGDLVNPYNVPLNVQRLTYLTSAVAVEGNGAALAAPFDDTSMQYDPGSTPVAGVVLGLDRRYVKCRISTNENFQIVKDYVPLGSVFDPAHRSWVVKSPLAPNGYYILSLKEEIPIFPGGVLAGVVQARVSVALVGHIRVSRGGF